MTGIARNEQKRESGGVRGSKTYHVAFTGPCTALWNNNLSKLRAVNSQIISTYVQKFAQWRKFADVHFWTYLIISVSTPFNLAHLGCKTILSPESKQQTICHLRRFYLTLILHSLRRRDTALTPQQSKINLTLCYYLCTNVKVN